MEGAIRDAAGDTYFIDATRLATRLFGDAIASNLFLLGYAYQHGLVPVGATAIDRAIELNGVAVEANRGAFLWGRRAAVDPARVAELATPKTAMPTSRKLSQSLDEVIARRVDFLTDYQDQAYAQSYLDLVVEVRTKERAVMPGDAHAFPLTAAVARYLFKLMAYKDEYEVARLYTAGTSSSGSTSGSKATTGSRSTSRRRCSRSATRRANWSSARTVRG